MQARVCQHAQACRRLQPASSAARVASLSPWPHSAPLPQPSWRQATRPPHLPPPSHPHPAPRAQALGDVFSALSAAVGAADKVVELMKRQPAVAETGALAPAQFQGKITLQVGARTPSWAGQGRRRVPRWLGPSRPSGDAGGACLGGPRLASRPLAPRPALPHPCVPPLRMCRSTTRRAPRCAC